MGKRNAISPTLIDTLLFESNRICCICTIQGKEVQIHHIDKNSANSVYENLIVLCLDCHSKVHTSGGFGRNWTVGQLQQHKKEWIERVKLRKEEADKLASIQSVTGYEQTIYSNLEELDYKSIENSFLLKSYLEKILLIHKGQLLISQAEWDTGITNSMIQGSDNMIAFYETILVELSTFYPKDHFEKKHPKIFFNEQISFRSIFQRCAAKPEEGGWLPSMQRSFISYRLMKDIRNMVKDIAVGLMESSAEFDPDEYRKWVENWIEN